MMRQDQSSPVTDHRFSGIIGCSAFAQRKAEPTEPSLNPRESTWVQCFSSPFQCVAPPLNPLNPNQTENTHGDDATAAWQRLGRLHVSGAYIGKLGSEGSEGSEGSVVGCKRSSPATDHRFPLFLLPISPAYFSCLFLQWAGERGSRGARGARGIRAALRNPIIAFRRSGTGPSLWGRAAGTQTPEKTPFAKIFAS